MLTDYLCQVLNVFLLSNDLAYALNCIIEERYDRTLCARLSTRTNHKAPKLAQALIYALNRHTMALCQHPHHQRSRILVPFLLLLTVATSYCKPIQEPFRIKVQRRLKFRQVFQILSSIYGILIIGFGLVRRERT